MISNIISLPSSNGVPRYMLPDTTSAVLANECAKLCESIYVDESIYNELFINELFVKIATAKIAGILYMSKKDVFTADTPHCIVEATINNERLSTSVGILDGKLVYGQLNTK